MLNGKKVNALVDTGCSRSIVSCKHIDNTFETSRRPEKITMMNGDVVLCKGTWSTMVNKNEFPLNCLVSNVVPGYGMLLGMDAITILGGVHVSGGGRLIQFGCDVSSTCAAGVVSGLQIEDQDFSARFEDGKWVVKYKWVNGAHEPVL